ncbi:Gfo/Idh/MocA family oxidoreductase [bacterium]|nr:Gfo/Idh/MocA family oxidoreductase [bacterium]
MRKYRGAILGCGGRGNSQAAAYNFHPNVSLVALCDIDESRLKAAGEKHRVQALYTDFHNMIEQEQPDIVAIPTRTNWHCELTLAVLEHKVNVIVEKPIGVDLIEADRMVAAAEKAGVQLAVHHQWSLCPRQRKAKEMIKAGAIGEPIYLQSSGKGYYGGYGLMNIGTHILDQVRNFAGTPEWCFAHETVNGRDITATDIVLGPAGMGLMAAEQIVAHYSFKDGLYATSEYRPRNPIDTLRALGVDVIGTDGILSLKGHAPAQLFYYPDKVWTPQDASKWQKVDLSVEETTLYGQNFQQMNNLWIIDEMVNALNEGREHATSGRNGRLVLEMIMAIHESQRRKARVNIPLEVREHPLKLMLEEAGLPIPTTEIGYQEWRQSFQSKHP